MTTIIMMEVILFPTCIGDGSECDINVDSLLLSCRRIPAPDTEDTIASGDGNSEHSGDNGDGSQSVVVIMVMVHSERGSDNGGGIQ